MKGRVVSRLHGMSASFHVFRSALSDGGFVTSSFFLGAVLRLFLGVRFAGMVLQGRFKFNKPSLNDLQYVARCAVSGSAPADDQMITVQWD